MVKKRQMSGRQRNGGNGSEIKDRMRKKLAQKHGPKKLCLTMIVKNESMNMERLLNSVEKIIDIISIVDTGSTDDTEEIILKWGRDHNIPTTVHHEKFRNFAYNRTHSIRMAKATYPEADYYLLSDADFVWEINKGNTFDKVLLVDHKYLIEQHNKVLSYANIRMLSAKVDWECVGRTHEYWKEADSQSEYKGEVRTGKIRTLEIDDREDGGCKDDKFERDERLLREGLADPEEPGHLKTRYKFYLAQTLKDLNRHEESIEWYKKREEDGGWPEEVYYSIFQMGFNCEQLAWKLKYASDLMGKSKYSEGSLEKIERWNPAGINHNVLMSHLKNVVNLMGKPKSTKGTYEKIERWNPNGLHHNEVMNNLQRVINIINSDKRTDIEKSHIDMWNPEGLPIEAVSEIVELIKRGERTIPEEEYIKKWNPKDADVDEIEEILKLLEQSGRTRAEEEHIEKWNPDGLTSQELADKSREYFADASTHYMRGYKYRPSRAESLYYLTRMYRVLGVNDGAFESALIGTKIKYPENDSLFIERACYDYLFDFELSVTAYYIEGSKDIGRQAVVRLMERDDLPEDIKQAVTNNSRHYI